MHISLQNLTALICGSTQGIGLAIAETFAEAGANCILLARNEDKLKDIASSLPRINVSQQHSYEVADFFDANQVEMVVRKLAKGPTVHILVNNTGGPRPGPIAEATADSFLRAFQQHLVNSHTLVQALLPGMKAVNYGRIINIISTSVRVPIPNLGVSNTTRGAVASWAKTLSNEVAEYGITVNNILPGLTETQRLKNLINEIAKARGISEERVQMELKESIPAKRFGQAKELAHVACFLASAHASYVNGVSIPVDGGRTGTI